ncbi:protein of unknown function DUF1470 [Kribbella flavida DSM 17836]|uniref:Zinc finger CGNR domain-containing protein n=1 Tax=Kribbella flavida (strain DSM 17836 / JCM 10339 / NBRC 14399) TaxID=479435 RepID=D2PQ01_KRIFD|nr:CGNR zinc finger domain-containing protein [Kribbella flavida]ADB32925.1 protein of unknown function DUF1470 [Kribbella flavida DSM 17836]
MFIEGLPPATVVAVVNGWGSEPRRAGHRQELPPLPDALLPPWAEADDAGLEWAADRLFPIFASTDLTERAESLAAVLDRTKVRPTVRYDAEGFASPWLVEPRHAVLAAAALTLRTQFAEHDPARVGLCSAGNCADVYIDVSARAHRRFCSVTCQNRTRTAAYRRRRSATP